MRKPFTTNLDPDLVKKIKIRAINEGRSVADIIESCLSDYLKRMEKKEKSPPKPSK